MKKQILLAAFTILSACGVGSQDSEQKGLYKSGVLWTKTNLKVCFEPTSDATATQKESIRDIIANSWQLYIPIDFTGWGTCGSAAADIRILAHTDFDGGRVAGFGADIAKHRDIERDVDGRTVTLPGNMLLPIPSTERKEGIVRHEFGHALGLFHEHDHPKATECQHQRTGSGGVPMNGYDPESIMGYCRDDQELSPGDIRVIQELYGRRNEVVSRVYSAAVMHPNGKAYFFSGSRYYRFDFELNKVDKIGEIGVNGWLGLNANPGASVRHPNGKTYFFSGTTYQRFDHELDRVDKTARIGSDGWKGVPTHIDSAVNLPNGKAYFFKGHQYYRFNFELDEVDRVGVIGIDGWKGLPEKTTAGLLHPNGKAYLLIGNRYFRYNPSDDLVDKIGFLSEDGWEGL